MVEYIRKVCDEYEQAPDRMTRGHLHTALELKSRENPEKFELAKGKYKEMSNLMKAFALETAERVKEREKVNLFKCVRDG